MRIPLRLAITGQVEEGREASAEAQQPWSIRLAGRLLCMLSEGAPGPSAGTPGAYAAAGSAPLQCQAEKEEEGDVEEGAAAGDGEALLCGPSVAGRSIAALQAGSASPWQPYLAVLPDCVPSPLTTFSWEDVQAIEVGPRGRGAGGGGGGGRCRRGRLLWAAQEAGAESTGGWKAGGRGWHSCRLHSQITNGPPAFGSRSPPPLMQYPPMRKTLDHASWLATSAAQQPGGSRFSREQWEWALSVRLGAGAGPGWPPVLLLAPPAPLLLVPLASCCSVPLPHPAGKGTPQNWL